MKHLRMFIIVTAALAAGVIPAVALAGTSAQPEAVAHSTTNCTTLPILSVTLTCATTTTPASSTSSTTASTGTTATTVTAPQATPSAAVGVGVGTGTVTTASATLNGSVNLDGDTETSCNFVYGTSTAAATTDATCTPTPTSATTTPQPVSATVTGLAPATTYYYNLQLGWAGLALPPFGTATGPSFLSFTTPTQGVVPTVATAAATVVGGTSATLEGTVNPNNWSISSCSFSYTTSGGTAQTANCATTPSGATAQTVSAAVTGLTAGTAYNYTLSVGYGSGTSATTVTSTAGTVTTTLATVAAPQSSTLTASGATLTGSVNPEGQTVTDCEFYYGTAIATLTKVPCNPAGTTISGTSPTTVTAAITGLSPNVTYIDTIVLTTTGGALAVAPLGQFATPAVAKVPTATAGAATAVTSTTALLHAVVNGMGEGVKGCEFVWGTSSVLTTQGQDQALTQNCTSTPADNGAQNVTATLKGLAPGTRYYIALVFSTYGGFVESNQVTFNTRTSGVKPTMKLSSHTLNKTKLTATFKFARTGSTLATKGFQCALAPVTKGKVGRIVYSKCLSPKTYKKLKKQTYVFYVRAGNAVGYSAAKSYRFTL